MSYEYEELCPHCNNNTTGNYNHTLLDTCKHCGNVIKICSSCPATCPARENQKFRVCEGCDFTEIDCASVDCSDCIAGRLEVRKVSKVLLRKE